MTRVLVVHHDLDLADQDAESLRRFGYNVIECGGPTRLEGLGYTITLQPQVA
jgi:hypothetical protein